MTKKIILLIISTNLLVILCAYLLVNNDSNKKINPTYQNNSGYIWKTYKAKEKLRDSFWVILRMHENKVGTPLKFPGRITNFCMKYDYNNKPIILKRSVSNAINEWNAITYGSYSVDTKPYLFKENDSVTIDFILNVDDRAFVQCE